MTEGKKKEFYAQTENLISNEHLRAAIWDWIDQAITDACKKQRFNAGEMATELQRIAMRYNTVVSTEAINIEFKEIFDKYFPSPTEG